MAGFVIVFATATAIAQKVRPIESILQCMQLQLLLG